MDGRLVRIQGSTLHPMSRGGVCPHGVAGVQMLYHPERLAGPLIRTGDRGAGEWREASGDEALGMVVDRLQSLRTAGRSDALAVLAGYCAGTMNDLWNQFLTAFGSPNYVSDASEDGSEAVMSLMHGISRRPSYDLERSELVVSFGAPLFESWWSPLQAYVAYGGVSDGEFGRPRLVQVDTRFSRTASQAQEWVGIRPGTHAVLALGLAYVLIRDELYDADFVAKHVSGFENYTDEQGRVREGYRSVVMRGYRTEEVSAITGVPVERITSLARALAEAQPATVVCGNDVTLSPQGLLAGMAVHSLNVLLGNINRPGGILFGEDPPLLPLVEPTLDETARAGSARTPAAGEGHPFGAGNQALRFAEAVAAGDEGDVDTLFVYFANPLSSSSRPAVWERALEKVPFIVSFSPFLDETTRYADLILPDLTAYERWQDAPAPSSYPYMAWGLARPVVEPHAGGTSTGEAILSVAQRLGGSLAQSLPYESIEALLQERARGLFGARRGMTFGNEFERRHLRQMEERGWWLPEHSDFDSFWSELVDRGGWTDLFHDNTDPAGISSRGDGRIALFPERLVAALEAEGRGRRPYVTIIDEEVAPEGYPLRLIPYRVSKLDSGSLALERWLAEQPTIFPDVQWVPWVEVNPETSHELGLGDGTMVWVVSERGRYRARLKVFPGTARENVCAPYGLRHPNGEVANPLRLLDGSGDPLTGLPAWFTTFVRLERA